MKKTIFEKNGEIAKNIQDNVDKFGRRQFGRGGKEI